MSDKLTQGNEPRSGEPSLSRRRMLKAAVATAPVIATLPSGAALARSSNLIGPTAGPGTDALGRTLCLDANSGTWVDGMIDLGPTGDGHVSAIRERDYRLEARGGAAPISEKDMCRRGGEFYYQASGWQSAKVPRGIVVSATALSSFAGSIYIRDV